MYFLLMWVYPLHKTLTQVTPAKGPTKCARTWRDATIGRSCHYLHDPLSTVEHIAFDDTRGSKHHA